MNRKENDLMMNVLANPDFSLNDFASVGLNIDNTSIESMDTYRNNQYVKDFFTEDGKFNEKDFVDTYQSSLIGYNQMAQEALYKEIDNQITFHRDNIWAPIEKRRSGPDTTIVEGPNPDRITSSLIRLGEIGPRTKTADELAQGQKVLLNPVEVEKGGVPQWGEAPEDDFTGYFFDTLVLAQYENDVLDEKGEVIHKKGEYKTNYDGTYYYEKLDGRKIYDKHVLNKMNVLTKEGSYWNQYDFFDSDDIKKSVTGTVMKNIALVAPMFIPYVGPAYIGLNVATQLVGLFGTFGKMFAGSDTPVLSEMEGWAKSINQQGNISEYARQNTWCWENWINLIGDVARQLKEQRFIFEKVPGIFTGKFVGSKSQYQKFLDDLVEKHRKINTAKVTELAKIDQRQALEASVILNSAKHLGRAAQAELDAFMKTYNKIGSILGRGYMTGIVVQDTYGEAINAGASDIEATMLTIGYAVAEYVLLSSDIGKWIMPELRETRFRNKAIIDAVRQAKKQTAKQTAGQLDKSAKKQYIKNLFNIGKNAMLKAHTEYASSGKNFLGATMAAASAEGTEELSEEILADFAKGCYNVYSWLGGEKSRMNSFGFSWQDGTRSWNVKDIFDRYAMSLIGGGIGGSIANIGNNWRMGRQFSDMSYEKAIQELIYIGRNEGFDNFRKQLGKTIVAPKHLSARIIENNGARAFEAAKDYEDSQDFLVKQAFNKQLDMIEELLNAEGAAVSDESFLSKQTEVLKDLRYDVLHESVLAGRFMQEFNSALSNLVQLKDSMGGLSQGVEDKNNSGAIEDHEKRNADKNKHSEELKKYEKEYKELSKKIQDLVTGKRAAEFIGATLWDMSAAIQNVTNETLPTFVKRKYGKEYHKLSKDEKQQALRDYRDYKIETADDKFRQQAIYRAVAEKASKTIKASEKYYQEVNDEISNLVRNLSDAYESFQNLRDADPESQLAFAEHLESLINHSKIILKSRGELESINESYREALNTIPEGIDPEYTKQLKEDAKNSYLINIQTAMGNAVNEIIDNLENIGQINPEVLNHLEKLANFTIDNYESKSLEYEEGSEESDFFSDLSNQLRVKLNRIKELPFTQVVQSLNDFLISIDENPLNITDLLSQINSILNDNKSDLAMFNLTNNLLHTIENAVGQLNMYEMAILGARTDAAGLADLYGYNATLNEVAKKLGDKSDLAEIDSTYADFLIQDIRAIKNKLLFAKQLFSVTSGQKLSQHNRVSVKKDILIFKQIRGLVNVPDREEITNWQGFNSLREVVESCETLIDLSENSSKAIEYSPELKNKAKEERIKIEDALYEFFNHDSNKNNLQNPEQLSQLLKHFDLYTKSTEILDENLESIDGPTMVWYLAGRAAIKASDFYGECKELLANNKLALVPSQELAIYNNYAGIMNGDIFAQFFEGYKHFIKTDWKNKSPEERKNILTNVGGYSTEQAEKYSDDTFKDYVSVLVDIPQYKNIMLTEGIPGSGKTTAVFGYVAELLKRNSEGKQLLDKALVIHGSDIEDDKKGPVNATKLSKSLGFGEAMLKGKFMQKIAPKYAPWLATNGVFSVPDSDFEINKDFDISCKLGISEQDPPSLIVIDEVSKFNTLELDLIDKYARNHGITVIVAGDYDQNGVTGVVDLVINSEKHPLGIQTHRNNFARSIKLGIPMRTDNSIKTRNQSIMQDALYKQVDSIEFQYYEDEKGLYGDKVISTDETALQQKLAAFQSSGKSLEEYLTQPEAIMLKAIISNVDALIRTSKEPIGFIYNDPNSVLFKILSLDRYNGKIDFKFGGSAQGNEAQYYIIDFQGGIHDQESKQDLYTGITRASQGSLVVTRGNIPLKSTKMDTKIDSPLSAEAIKKYNDAEKRFLDNTIKDFKAVPYTGRSKEKVAISSTPSNTGGLGGATPIPTPPPAPVPLPGPGPTPGPPAPPSPPTPPSPPPAPTPGPTPPSPDPASDPESEGGDSIEPETNWKYGVKPFPREAINIDPDRILQEFYEDHRVINLSYILYDLLGVFPKISDDILEIQRLLGNLIFQYPENFDHPAIRDIRTLVEDNYGQEGLEILDEMLAVYAEQRDWHWDGREGLRRKIAIMHNDPDNDPSTWRYGVKPMPKGTVEPQVALDYLLTGGKDSIYNAGYFLCGIAAAFPDITEELLEIRRHLGAEILGMNPAEFASSGIKAISDIAQLVKDTYGDEGIDILGKLFSNATGFIYKEGHDLGLRIEALKPLGEPSNNELSNKVQELKNASAEDLTGLDFDNKYIVVLSKDDLIELENNGNEWIDTEIIVTNAIDDISELQERIDGYISKGAKQLMVFQFESIEDGDYLESITPQDVVTHILEYEESEPVLGTDSLDAYDFDDDIPLTDNGVKNEEKYKEEIMNSTEEADKTDHTQPFPEKCLQLYTFNTLETGVLFKEDKNTIISDPDRMAARIDGVNGLLKIDALIGRNVIEERKDLGFENLEQYYIDRISTLRSIIFNTEEKAKISEQLGKKLRLQNIFINFAIKTSPTISQSTKDSDEDYVSKNPDPYGKSKFERCKYHNSLDNRSSEVIPHQIVAIIGGIDPKGNNTREILEIPLFTLSSPLTLAQIKTNDAHGSQDRYPELASIIRANRNEYGSYKIKKHELLEQLLGICNNLKDTEADVDGKYTNFAYILELYLYTYNGLYRINDPRNPADDWTPAKDLINRGPHVVTEAGMKYDKEAELTSDFKTLDDEQWTTIKQLSKMPIYKVSKKMYCTRESFFDGVEMVNAGHPFILISFDKTINNDSDMIEYYKEWKASGETKAPKVKLVYILPPSSPIDTYLEHLDNIARGNADHRHIGNLLTPFKLLDLFLRDREFKQKFDGQFPGDSGLRIETAINDLRRLSNTNDIVAKLQEIPGWYGSTLRLLWHLRHTLLTLAYKKNPDINKEAELDPEIIGIMKRILEENKFKIFHKAKISKNSAQNNDFMIFDQGDDYTIDGLPCRVFGKIDGYIFEGNFMQFISKAVKSIHSETTSGNYKVQKMANDYNDFYDVEQESAKQFQKDFKKEVKKAQRLIGKKAVNEIINSVEITNINSYREAIIKAVRQLREKLPDRFIFLVNGVLKISEPIEILQQMGNHSILNDDNSEIFSLYENRSYRILDNQGIEYAMNYSEGIIEIIPPVEQNTSSGNALLNITEEQFNNNLKPLFSKISISIEDYLNMDIAYKSLLQAETFEDFRRQLGEYFYMGEFRIQTLEGLLNDSELSDIASILIEFEKSMDPYKEDDNQVCPTSIKIRL